MTNAPPYRNRWPQIYEASSALKFLNPSYLGMFAWQKRQVMESPSTSTTFIVEEPRPIQTLQRRSSQMARNALGRGLGALIREQEVAPQTIPQNSSAGAATAATPAPIA